MEPQTQCWLWVWQWRFLPTWADESHSSRTGAGLDDAVGSGTRIDGRPRAVAESADGSWTGQGQVADPALGLAMRPVQGLTGSRERQWILGPDSVSGQQVQRTWCWRFYCWMGRRLGLCLTSRLGRQVQAKQVCKGSRQCRDQHWS